MDFQLKYVMQCKTMCAYTLYISFIYWVFIVYRKKIGNLNFWTQSENSNKWKLFLEEFEIKV